MQLTRFSDLGLRVLMYLSATPPESVTTIAEITDRFQAAPNHMTKIVQFMGQQGWLRTLRGKGGGIQLAWPQEDYRLGQLIRTLERDAEGIDCAKSACALRGRCSLKGLLDEAFEAFYDALDRYTLADAVAAPTHAAIVRLLRREGV